MTKLSLFGGKLHLYKRPNSHWQCSTYLGRNRRKSTKTDSLEQAKEIAEDWYYELKGKHRAGLLKDGKRFREVAKVFLTEYRALTDGERSPEWVAHQECKLDKYLLPYFGPMIVPEITPGTVQEYRIHRSQNGYRGMPPSRGTIEHEISLLRQVLNTAKRHNWLAYVPDISPPFKASRKVTHRAWFSKEEYRQLYEATRERAKNPKKKCWKWESEQLHDYVLFMANTGLRPDESARLEYRDVRIVKDYDTGQTILEIEVRGKTGVGHCKSTDRAVRPFLRLRARNEPAPSDRVFPKRHRELFRNILDELKLRKDRDGNLRSAYSLRHTYICFRLMEGANIYQIAKNCRTSVEVIETHYAAHIKNTLNAADINVRRSKPPKRGEPA
jgi:integrase